MNNLSALQRVSRERNILKYQLIGASGIARLQEMAEMARTQRELEAAGIPLEQTPHGVVIPSTAKAQMLMFQSNLLRDTQKQAATVGTGYVETTRDLENYTSAYEEKLAETLDLKGEIYRLLEELKNRPVIEKQGGLFDFSFPSLGDIKTPLIIGAIAIGGLFLAGKWLSRGK